MKKILFCHMVSVVLMTSIAHASTGFGICNFGKETVPSIICYGPTVLDSTVVTSYIKVAGPLSARKAMAGSIFVKGTVYLQDSTIKGPVVIVGKLVANRVKIEDNLTISSDNTLLMNSTVNGSVIVNSKKINSYLILQCGTQINGSVNFNGSKGWIQTSGDSVIHGKVENATIEFVKRTCD